MRRLSVVSIAFCGLAVLCAGSLRAADEDDAEQPKAIQPEAVDLGRPVDFEKDIVPILDLNCVACHNVAIAESRFNAEDVASMLKGGKRGAALVPGEPDKSLLFHVAARGKQPAMPPMPNEMGAEPLTPKELGTLRQWILEGAKSSGAARMRLVEFHPIPAGRNAIFSVAVSPWGRYAAAGRANQILLYDLGTGEELGRLTDPALEPVEHEGDPMYPDGAAHRDFVHALAFSPDGTLLASAGYRVVKLWKQTLASTKLPVEGHAVTAVAATPDGRRAAVATADHVIRLVDLVENKPGATLSGHTDAVTALQFSADGAKLFSSSLDQSIRIWNAADGEAAGQIDTPAAVNDLVLNKEATQVVSAGADNILRVWAVDPPGEEPAAQMTGHGQPVTSVDLLLPAGQQIVSGSEDGTVRIWNLAGGQQVRSMNHGGPVRAVAARPDGQAVASAGANNMAKLWRADNGQQIAELKGAIDKRRELARRTEDQRIATELQNQANTAATAAEKAAQDSEAAHKTAQEALTKATEALAEPQKSVDDTGAALEAAKSELEGNSEDEALKKKVADAQKAFDEATAKLKTATDAREAADRAAKLAEEALNREKQLLEAANSAKEAAAARLAEAKQAHEAAQQTDGEAHQPVTTLAFSPDGKLLVTGSEGQLLHVWNASDGRPLEIHAGHEGPVATVVFAGERKIISGSADQSAVIRDLVPTWTLAGRLGVSDEEPLDLSSSPFVDRVLALDFSPDGTLLATGGGDPSRSGELMLWNVAEKSLVREIEDAHSDTVLGVEFSRDGRFLLSGGTDKFAKVFEVESGNHVRSFEGHTHHVMDVSWKADGTQIVTAGADNAIKVWNVETGEQARTISNYPKQVTAIQFVGDSDTLASCGGDATVRFHRASNGQNYRSFGGSSDYVYSVAVARDAETAISPQNNQDCDIIVAGGEDGTLRVWNAKNGQSLFTFAPPKAEESTAQASVAGAQE